MLISQYNIITKGKGCSNTSHGNCDKYQVWKKLHPDEYQRIKSWCDDNPRSVYVNFLTPINIQGKNIKGAIKSCDPPCLGIASASGPHPYTCTSCQSQMRDIESHLRKRQDRRYTSGERIGRVGFRHSYATKFETRSALQKSSKQPSHVSCVESEPSTGAWEHLLMSSCLKNDHKQLVKDLVKLFEKDIDSEKPVQYTVLKNLVGQLNRGRNHHFTDDMKRVSKMYRHKLGRTNYELFKQLFGLCSNTTCDNMASGPKLSPGFNWDVFDKAADVYSGQLVVDCSDDARTTRCVQPHKGKDGEIHLLGEQWSADCNKWGDKTPIPRSSVKDNDESQPLDDYSLLDDYVKRLIESESLSKSTSIHNFSSLTSIQSPNLIFCMWPVPTKGMTGKHLLNIWQQIRRICYFTSDGGSKRDCPIRLMGHSTDAAGFSLNAAVLLMSPTKEHVDKGIIFLRLDVPGERFVAPYFWDLCPSIAYLDWDHAQRCLLRCLKYPARELTMFKCRDGSKIATIHHLKQLKSELRKHGIQVNLNEDDLVLLGFHDQQVDAAYRVFTLDMVNLLCQYVPGSDATCLYISAVYHLVQPFRTMNVGSPSDVQKSVSTGILILRLWRKYLELKRLRLDSRPGAKNDTSKCGHFITYGAHMSAEILFAAATLHNLALHRHQQETGLNYASPHLSGTRTTERIISELQGKTTEIQSLDQQPTFVDMLHRADAVQFNQNVTKSIGTKPGIAAVASSNRKKTIYDFNCQENTVVNSKYPEDYADFQSQQKAAHYAGVKAAQRLVEKFVPEMKPVLMDSGVWDVPYEYSTPNGCMFIDRHPLPDDYNKLDVSINYAETVENVMSNDDDDDGGEDDIESGNVNPKAQDTAIRDAQDDTASGSSEKDMSDSESDDSNAGNPENSAKKAWYLSRKVGDEITHIHVSKALKLIIGKREYVSRERSRRHYATKNLPDHQAVNEDHDIHLSEYYAVKMQDSYNIGKLLVIRKKDGNFVSSTKSGDNDCTLRFALLKKEGDHFIITNLVSQWRSTLAVIGHVDVSHEDCRDGNVFFSATSINKINKVMTEKKSKVKRTNDEKLDADQFEVESIIDSRINPTSQATEYKVRFKGYGPEGDTWLPSSAFNSKMDFQSISARGRKRKHTIQKDESVDPFALNFIEDQPSIAKSKTQDMSTRSRQCKIDTPSATSPLESSEDLSAVAKSKKQDSARNATKRHKGGLTTASLRASPTKPRYIPKLELKKLNVNPLTLPATISVPRIRPAPSIIDPNDTTPIQPMRPSSSVGVSSTQPATVNPEDASVQPIESKDVAKWGGKSSTTHLVNTCPLDNILSILSIEYNRDAFFKNFIDDNSPSDTSVHAMREILIMCQNKQWTTGRVKWLTTFGGMTWSPFMDSFGSERERGIFALMKTKLANLDGLESRRCSNKQCPGQEVHTRIQCFKLRKNDRLVLVKIAL